MSNISIACTWFVTVGATVCSLSAAAQDAATVPEPATAAEPGVEEPRAVETVIVVGKPIRDSQAAAIEAKRESGNVLDVISADTIGRFPDQNLADSLGRLPGIAIERDQGQARYINFRGLPFRYTAIAFDGIEVPGAENGRVPRFDSIPAVITRVVEANKAVTPAMPGAAVAGYINIRTFDPFEREGLSASVEGGYGNQELGDGDVEKYSGRLSYSNDNFGFTVFGSLNRRVQITDNREFDLEIDETSGELLVNELQFRNYEVERSDSAYGGRLEYRPSSGALDRIFVSTLYSEFVDEEERNQFVFDFAGGAAATESELASGASGYQPVVLVSRLLEDGRYENSTLTTTLGIDGSAGGWSLEGRANYTETTNDMFLPIPRSTGGTLAASYDLSDVLSPQLHLFQTGTMTPAALESVEYAANLGILYSEKLDNEAWKLKLDAGRDLTLFGLPTRLQVGGQFDTRDGQGYGTSIGTQPLPEGVDPDDYRTRPWYTNFDNTIGGTYYDNVGLRDAWEAAAGGLRPTGRDDQIIQIEEQIIAGYAMATSQFSGGNVVYGLRLEHTDYTSDGPAIDVSYSDDYLTALPSVHLNLDLQDDLKLRISGTTGIGRPAYSELRASASVDPTNQTIIGGNPALDPETIWGGDISLEWYYAPASLLSAGAFYRHISDVIYADSTTVDGGFYLESAAGEEWDLVGFVNGRDGEVSGLEFNFIGSASDLLPTPFDGFGVSANLSLLDSEFETNSGASFSLPGTSDMIFNASIFYENFGLSVRVNYQYRDAWLSTTENDSLGEYWDEQERVDLSARYLLPLHPAGTDLTVFVNANNLTDEIDVRYIETPATPNQVEGYGRYWVAGLRLDY